MKYRHFKPPLQNSYWVVPGFLLAGEYPGTKESAPSTARLEAMVSAGITRFIDLTTPDDGLEPYEALLHEASDGSAMRYSFGIRDVGIPEHPDLMVAILDTIDRELCAGNGVYVHCWGGVGRTGTVIGCWLQRHFADQGLIHHPDHGSMGLAELWKTCPKSARKPDSPETEAQRAYVRSWHESDIIRLAIDAVPWEFSPTSVSDTALEPFSGTGSSKSLPEPRIVHPVPREQLLHLSAQFHTLIMERAAHLIVEQDIRLPRLDPLCTMEQPLLWCPIPGMYGGFRVELHRAGNEPQLLVSSWVRVVGGSGQTHLVMPHGYVMLEEGFV